jgi:predicted aldo/keto reductase-like oxidoreductase
MRKRLLGKTGLVVSEVGFGGIPIQRVDLAAVKSIMMACLQRDITFLDSARGYTTSEEMIGEAIEGHRDSFVLATKTMAKSYEHMKRDIDISLINFRTNHIELYQAHFVRNREAYDALIQEGGYEAMVEAKREGLIGHIGITSHDHKLLEEIIEDGRFETIQFPYNLVEHQGERLFQRANALGIGVIAMKPLAGGAISNGPLSLKYILNNPHISVAIPGMDSPEQVFENSAMGSVDLNYTEEDLRNMEIVRQEMGEHFCRRCGYCLPCPQGLDIPTLFLMEGYLKRYGLKEWAQERYATMAGKAAADCIQCGICETRCPYDLPIRQMLKKVDESFR